MADNDKTFEQASELAEELLTAYDGTLFAGHVATVVEMMRSPFNASGDAEMSAKRKAAEAALELAESTLKAEPRIKRRRKPPADDPKYKTPPFRCLQDYNQCSTRQDWRLCLALFIVCIGRQLIPFVPKK